MRLTTLILFVSFMQASAIGFSQTINLKKSNVPLTDVFKEIRKQTGYDFVFTHRQMEHARPVSIEVKNMPLHEVLARCFENQPFSYRVHDNTIIVTAKKVEQPKAVQIQQPSLTGVVLDVQGNAIPGVSVAIKNAKNKDSGTTLTDGTGQFVLPVRAGDVLVFTSVGYRKKEIRISNERTIQVQLEPEVSSIDDVVVVGYGSLQRKDLTGSVASVNVDEIRNVPFATIDQALTGKAAGVQVVQADGSPGGVAKIRIRGGTSLMGGNDPLYIIDGVQITIQNRYKEGAAEMVSPTDRVGQDDYQTGISGSFARGLNSLGGLNFNDIESIDILKDASATAIYGSRAANGVVIITTKKGRQNQKPVFDANFYGGFSTPITEKLLNAEQYTMITMEAARNLNAAREAIGMPPFDRASAILNDPGAVLGTAKTDWYDLILRDASTQNGDISVRGGGAGTRYYTSLGFNRNNGVVRGTDYSRIAGKVSLDNEITPNLRFSTNLNYGFTTNNITNGAYTQALYAPPTFDPYNADGSPRLIAPEDMGTYAYQGFQNPLLLLKGTNRSQTTSLIGSLAGEYDILQDLTFKSSVAINYGNYLQENYVPSTVSVVTAGGGVGSSNNGMATRSNEQDVNSFFENTLTWNKTFNQAHRLNLLLGTSWQINKANFFTAKGQGFPDDEHLNNLSAAAVSMPPEGGKRQNSLLSFYLRANYALLDRYIFTFTGRSDESSKFPKGNRVGYFPSGGVAWRISEEKFLQGVSWLDELKLRASMGTTGTQNIGDNLFYTLYNPMAYAGRNALVPSQLGNDRIRWESTLQKDAGINFSLFEGRMSGELALYEKKTTGVLFPMLVAPSSGFPEVTANMADIQNRGWEVQLSGDFIRKKDFQWSGILNISSNRSKVLTLENFVPDRLNPDIYRYGNTILKVGEPLGLFYGRVYEGILRTEEEVEEYRSKYWRALYGSMPYLGVGDVKLAIDETGQYKEDIIGRAEPKYYGGYTNNFQYRNFGFSFLTTFSKGNQILYLYDTQNMEVDNATNKGVRILDRYNAENPDSDRPRLLLGESSSAYVTSNAVHDASFIRLKSVTFSYRLPASLLDRWGVNNAMLYCSGTNLFTITSYPGADPEVSNDPYSLIGGYSDSAGYPTVRQFSFGFRLGF